MEKEQLLEKLSENDIFLEENSLQKLSGGKDNITYSATLIDGKKVVIQCMRSIHDDNHKDFMEAVIDHVNSHIPEIGFSPTVPGFKRFYKAENCYIQIMSALDGTNAIESDIDIDFIKKSAEKLAIFHKKIQNFSLENIIPANYHRDRVEEFQKLAENFVKNQNNSELNEIIAQYREKFEKISLDFSDIRKGIIHGDPVFKNFLLYNGEISGWIDYDMLSYTYQIWDLADMYRGYTKMKNFTREHAKILLESYESIFPLIESEKKQLPNFIKMMTLDTGYRYILALDENSGFYNAMGDSINKARRCLSDYEKVDEWF